MRECCKGCIHRSISDNVCTYILDTNEERGCAPEDCKALGRYEESKSRKRVGLIIGWKGEK